MARTDTLPHFLTDVADAIREKTGSSEPITASDFDTEIENIPSGGDPSEYFNTNPTAEELATPNYWVYNNYIKKVDVLYVPDTITSLAYFCSPESNREIKYAPKVICNNNVTDFNSMYRTNMSSEIDVSGLNTSNATDMNYMFYQCRNITSLDLSMLDFSKNSPNQLCWNCALLENVKLPATLRTGYSLARWFQNCYSLKQLIILKTDNICGYNTTLDNCYHMNGTVNATYNPQGLKDGRIYVPDALVDSYKTATGWSTYADQILPLSELPEEE